MAYIETIDEDAADGELAELYRRGANRDGTVDAVLKVHSLSPPSLKAHLELYITAMHRPSPLSRAEREMVATVVSRINGCDYCLEHHAAGLARLLPEERHGVIARLRRGENDCQELSFRERALVGYAEKLARAPQEMSERDLDPLRSAGLDDRGLLDLAQVVGYFSYVNRMVLGLGVALEGGEHALGQWPDE